MRLADWEARLGGLLDAAHDRPFALGEWDCALFGGAVVEALTGVDIGAPYRGRYSTVRGYKRALTAQGHDSIFGPFDAIAERRAPLLCGRGDIVSNGDAVGMMWAGHALFVGAPISLGGTLEDAAGLVAVPVSALRWGWRI